VLPLYEGETLAERLERGPLPVARALDVVRQAAEGLARAHREGIVHGDVKPENLMLTADGLVKILDFGLAGMSGERGRRGGTGGYMPPEAESGGRLDPRGDLYSLGVVLVDVLLGRSGTQRPRSHRPRPLEPELDALIEGCLEPEPARRIGSAREVVEALERVDSLRLMVALGELPSPDALATSPRTRMPSRRATVAGAILLVASLLLSGWLVERLDRWSELAPRRSAGSLLGVAEAAAGLAVAPPVATAAPAPSVRWGFVLDREAWAGTGARSPVVLWWRASRASLVGSPSVVRALDLGRVGPDEPKLGAGDLVRVAVGLDGTVLEATVLETMRAGAGTRGGAALAPALGERPEAGGSLYGFDSRLFVVGFAVLLVVTVVLARRNLARGQGDRRGAARLAGMLGGLFLLSWVAGGGHAPSLRAEFSLLVQAAGLALFYAALAGLFYLALEPRLRRHWPQVQVGWSRLFTGRLGDGVAARELLAGSLLGVAWFAVRLAAFGLLGSVPRVPNVRLLEGPGQWVGELANSLGTACALGLGVVVVMALVRERSTPRWLAPWIVAAIVTPALALAEPDAVAWAFWPAVALSAWWAVARFGALALAGAYLAFRLLWMGMLTPVPGELGFGVTVGCAALVLLLGLGPLALAGMAGRRARE
jgi:hypothetical protein